MASSAAAHPGALAHSATPFTKSFETQTQLASAGSAQPTVGLTFSTQAFLRLSAFVRNWIKWLAGCYNLQYSPERRHQTSGGRPAPQRLKEKSAF